MPVPHFGHFPFNAGLPFFKVTFTAFGSSCFALHLTQYIVAIDSLHLLLETLNEFMSVVFLRPA